MSPSPCSAADERVYCPECRRATEVVLDHGTGDTICTECALVLDAHYIDEGSEWRNFADDGGGDDRDPSRVGTSGDPFLNTKLSTVIDYTNKTRKSSATGVATKAPPRMSVPDAGVASENTLVGGFRGIADLADRLRPRGRRFCSRLGLGNQEVRDAQEAVRRVEQGLDVRRNPESVAAAISFMVVQRAGAGRSVKEVSIATGVAEGTIKEVHKDLTPHAQMLFG
ncbi:Transcription initiation factor IIB [Triticum urartu]|uniref:Transcription initiation factor IIB n=1 Tax=Triticum urartu TaxID=4572 RepID=M7ZBV8_TRIUA|nr:Transcription initiation factor IIB [Triticum urartu]